MREETITLAIFEKYSPDELAATAQQMAQAVSDMESTETEKKVSDAAFNERIKKHAAAVSELAKKYNKGGETAQIGCDIRYDHPEPGKKSYFRMDRNELVETHEMSWEEKQGTLQYPLAENQAPEPSVSEISAASLEKLAADPAPPAEKCQEEVTQMCPFPGCIHFAEHDGDHEIAPATAPPCDCPIAFPDNPELRAQVHRFDCPNAPAPAADASSKPEKPAEKKKRMRGQDAILPERKPDPPAPGAQA